MNRLERLLVGEGIMLKLWQSCRKYVGKCSGLRTGKSLLLSMCISKQIVGRNHKKKRGSRGKLPFLNYDFTSISSEILLSFTSF
jgi:hypothetical protein